MMIVGKLDPVKLDPKRVARGKKLISNDCSQCHRSNGSLGPLRMPFGNEALDGRSVTATEADLQSLAPKAP